MRIFIDTSAFYALLDRDDANNQKAKKAWTNLLGAEHTLVTSNYILVEAFALMQNRLGLEAVRGFQEDILPLITIEFVSPETAPLRHCRSSVCLKTLAQSCRLCQL